MGTEEEKTQATLATLDTHLAEVKKLAPVTTPPAAFSSDPARAALDFVSATTVGTLLGYGVDAWQNTLPWGMLVGLFIGTAAGLKMVLQNEARARAKFEAKKNDTDNA